MVRSAKSHHPPEEEDDDGEETAGGTGTDTSSQRDGKSAERKASNPRSKHSETEQRRRSKINERFQILRDLIPPNDQKRDKASLLLEVIEYIHFLQEKLQMYEGPCQQVWNQEPAKLISYRGNHGPVDSFGDHIQVIKNGSGHESNIVQPIANAQGPVEPEFSGDAICREADYRSGPTASGVPLNASLQPTMYTSGRTNLPAENIASQPCGSAIAECSIMGNARCEPERTFDSGTSNTSNGHSQGLLNRFTQALQTSGVDLTQASISVQLDIGKRPKIGATAIAIEDFGNQSPRNQAMEPSGEGSSREYSDHLGKRLKTGES